MKNIKEGTEKEAANEIPIACASSQSSSFRCTTTTSTTTCRLPETLLETAIASNQILLHCNLLNLVN